MSGRSFVVKENIDVLGRVSRNGEPDFAKDREPAGLDAPAVDRLLAAGARLVGKAHMDEMAYSLLGANHHYGTPVNPAAPDRHPGGSSSGSAVAVAAGLADFALGTDTAGSCRAPASFCGIFGFRPSHGAAPSNGVVPLAPSLDTIGWFARDIETMISVADVLLPGDVDDFPYGFICPPREAFIDVDPSFSLAATPLLKRLADAFHLQECVFAGDFFEEALAHFRNLQAWEAWRSHGEWIARANPSFGPGIKERFAHAATVTLEQKRAAEAFRESRRKSIASLLSRDGAFLVPTTPFPAPLLSESPNALDEKRYRMMRFFMIASFFGLPQVSLPLKTAGAPLGLSLIGRRWSDRGLLALARQVAAMS